MDNIDAHVIEKGGKITAPVMHQALYDVAVLDADAAATLPWREGYRNGGGGGLGKEEIFSFDGGGGENRSGEEEGDGQSGEVGKGRRKKKKKRRSGGGGGGSSVEDVEAMFGKRK